jgi:anti-sigma factor RsiW
LQPAFSPCSEDQGARVFYWIDGPFGYALAGDIDRDELQKIARGVHLQLNP